MVRCKSKLKRRCMNFSFPLIASHCLLPFSSSLRYSRSHLPPHYSACTTSTNEGANDKFSEVNAHTNIIEQHLLVAQQAICIKMDVIVDDGYRSQILMYVYRRWYPLRISSSQFPITILPHSPPFMITEIPMPNMRI